MESDFICGCSRIKFSRRNHRQSKKRIVAAMQHRQIATQSLPATISEKFVMCLFYWLSSMQTLSRLRIAAKTIGIRSRALPRKILHVHYVTNWQSVQPEIEAAWTQLVYEPGFSNKRRQASWMRHFRALRSARFKFVRRLASRIGEVPCALEAAVARAANGAPNKAGATASFGKLAARQRMFANDFQSSRLFTQTISTDSCCLSRTHVRRPWNDAMHSIRDASRDRKSGLGNVPLAQDCAQFHRHQVADHRSVKHRSRNR